jgi:hypothetical protein
MPASERDAQPRRQQHAPAERPGHATPSMRDLLASCAAASAVSTPPSGRAEPEDEPRRDVPRRHRHPEAA